MNDTLQASPELEVLPLGAEPRRSWAPWWHTTLLVAFLLLASWGSSLAVAKATPNRPHVGEYLGNMFLQWVLVAFVWWGLRMRQRSIKDAIGRTWKSTEDVVIDFAVAAGFWIASVAGLYGIQKLLGIANSQALNDRLRALQFMRPQSLLELVLFLCMALTAGFCEELLFRGYLQKQFTFVTHNVIAGIVISAVLFGLGHAYQGGKMMIVLGCYGAMFGTLAHFRRSLIPGMLAHAGQDSLVGVFLYVSKYVSLAR